MKSRRQEKIISLIGRYEIETQEDLIHMLEREGYKVTQATVSRDIRELKLTKVATGRGSYKYTVPSKKETPNSFKFNRAIIESIVSIDYSGNIIVIKTYTGMAQALATGLDAIKSPDLLGCVAGDDTIMVVTRGLEESKDISERLHSLLDEI